MAQNHHTPGNLKRPQTVDDSDTSIKRSRTSWPPVEHEVNYAQRMLTPNLPTRPVSSSSAKSQVPLYATPQRSQPLVRPTQAGDAEFGKVTAKILRHYTEEHQNRERYSKKMLLRDALFAIVKNVFPYSGLYMVGSSMNGFGSNTSDMDLCLMLSHLPIDQKNEAREILTALMKSFRCCSFLEKVQLIRAKVPILKFKDITTGIECDLNINNEIGIRNTHLLSAYAQLDLRLAPLVVFVKYWASAQTINDASQGTISSYSLALMVIHFLQVGCTPPVLPSLQVMYPQSFSLMKDVRTLKLADKLPHYTSPNKQSLGELFYGFLDYYTNIFNFRTDAISIRRGTRTSRDDVEGYQGNDTSAQWKFICIEEPFDHSNTARSVYDEHVFDRIKRVIRRSFADVRQTRCVDNIISVPM